MIDASVDVIAIRIQTPSGDGGRLRFLFRCGGAMIVDGRNTFSLVGVCVFIVFYGCELIVVVAFWRAVQNVLGECFNLGISQINLLP